MSTASATLLAPSTTFVENVLKNFVQMNDRQKLLAMRLTRGRFHRCACWLIRSSWKARRSTNWSSKAYQFPVVGAFWPLVCGLYWQRSTTQGAIWSIVLGMGTWALLEFTPLGEAFPPVLGGFLMAAVGMFGGSLLSAPEPRAQRAA